MSGVIILLNHGNRFTLTKKQIGYKKLKLQQPQSGQYYGNRTNQCTELVVH